MQAPAAITHAIPMSGILDMSVHTAALTKHNAIAKTPKSILAMNLVSTDLEA
jgi:hypothetical protein